MGLSRSAIEAIAKTLRTNEAYPRRALIIGKQDVYGDELQVRNWIRRSSEANHTVSCQISNKPGWREAGFIHDVSVLQMMGIQEVVTLDCSSYEGADFVWDLNDSVVSIASKIGLFDVVLDAGCMEHIFNVPMVLQNYFHLLRVDGLCIHILPASGHVNHGFYSFSPCLFSDYYTANKWQIEEQQIYKYSHSQSQWKSAGVHSHGKLLMYCVARKLSCSTCNARVQQSEYQDLWLQKKPDKWHSTKVKWILKFPLIASIIRKLL